MRHGATPVMAGLLLAACGPSAGPDADEGAVRAAAAAAPAIAIGPRAVATARPVAAAPLAATCRAVPGADGRRCRPSATRAAIAFETARACAALSDAAARSAGCRPMPRSPEAGIAVVRLYYDAIAARDYRTAWAAWGEGGRPGQRYADFVAGFADTRSVAVSVTGPAEGDAAMGSIYLSVPVRVDAVLRDGRRQRFVGRYAVRRVNGVDGATPAQLRWHLDSATVRPGS